VSLGSASIPIRKRRPGGPPWRSRGVPPWIVLHGAVQGRPSSLTGEGAEEGTLPEPEPEPGLGSGESDSRSMVEVSDSALEWQRTLLERVGFRPTDLPGEETPRGETPRGETAEAELEDLRTPRASRAESEASTTRERGPQAEPERLRADRTAPSSSEQGRPDPPEEVTSTERGAGGSAQDERPGRFSCAGQSEGRLEGVPRGTSETLEKGEPRDGSLASGRTVGASSKLAKGRARKGPGAPEPTLGSTARAVRRAPSAGVPERSPRASCAERRAQAHRDLRSRARREGFPAHRADRLRRETSGGVRSNVSRSLGLSSAHGWVLSPLGGRIRTSKGRRGGGVDCPYPSGIGTDPRSVSPPALGRRNDVARADS